MTFLFWSLTRGDSTRIQVISQMNFCNDSGVGFWLMIFDFDRWHVDAALSHYMYRCVYNIHLISKSTENIISTPCFGQWLSPCFIRHWLYKELHCPDTSYFSMILIFGQISIDFDCWFNKQGFKHKFGWVSPPFCRFSRASYVLSLLRPAIVSFPSLRLGEK